LRTAGDYARLKGFSEIEELLQEPDRKIPDKKIKRKKEINEEATKKLIDAIWNDNLDGVIAAIEDGADVHPKTGSKDIPIIIAAANGHIDIVALLLQEGADVNAKDSVDLSALAKASGACYVNIVKLLLKNGAEVTNDVLIAASVHKHSEIMQLLSKAQRMQGTPHTNNVKLTDGETFLLSSSSNNDYKGVKKALDEGVEVNIQDDDGATALFWASRKGFIEIVNLLVEAKADVNVKTTYAWTALMEASLNGHFEIVDKLITCGADVNALTAYGATALIFAASEGYEDIVKLLLDKGAKPDDIISDGNNKGMTALKYAKKNEHKEVIALLRKYLGDTEACPLCGNESGGGKYCSTCGAKLE
jgi:ankyrin repeat protein